MSDLASTAHDSTHERRPKVVYLGRNLRMGGAERVMVHYLNAAQRIRPIGVLLDAQGPLLKEVRAEVPLYTLAQLPSAVSDDARASPQTGGLDSAKWWRILREAWRLREVIRATGATLVSSFLMRSHVVALLARDLWCRDVRLVFNVHSMVVQSERYLYPDPVSRRVMGGFLHFGFPRADRIVAVAEGVAAELRDHVRVPEGRITVVHNPVDSGRILQAAADGPTVAGLSGPIIVAVGRMVRLKGFDLLLDAVARIDPSTRPAVIMVGDGPERPALAAQAHRLGLGSNVHMVGCSSNPWAYMAQASALVVSSRTEAFPNVIGEALVLGVPVVAIACASGIREYLQDAQCGIMVPPGDTAALSSTIRRVLTDADLRSRLRAAGPARADAFSLAAKVRDYESALLEALRG